MVLLITGRLLRVDGSTLFEQAFSDDDAKPGNPRLRLKATRTKKLNETELKNFYRAVRSLGDAVSAGMRNPAAHTTRGLDRDVALEELATLSLLSRCQKFMKCRFVQFLRH